MRECLTGKETAGNMYLHKYIFITEESSEKPCPQGVKMVY